MKAISLRVYLLLLAIIPLLLVALGMTGFIVPRYIADLREAHQSRSAALAEQMQRAAGFALFVGDVEQLQQLADGLLKSDPMVSAVWIRDVDNRVVGHAEMPVVVAAGDTKNDVRWFSLSVSVAAFGNRSLRSEFDQNPEPLLPTTLGQIDIQYDDAPFRSAYRRLLLVAVTAALVAVLIGSVFAIVLARRITRPLLSVSAAVDHIGQGKLDARALPDASGVLDTLVTGVNAMAQNIESMQDVLRWRIAEATAELRGQKDAAERATREKTRFLAAASHDLRQPLQALGLFVHRLRSGVATEERQRLEQRIDDAVASMQALLGSLLDLSALETQSVTVSPRHFAANEVLRPIIERYRPLAEQKGLRLSLRGGQHWLFADAGLLERVEMNLLSNAIKYTDHGGVLLACRQRGTKIRLEVHDSGIGIAPDNQIEIFQEFVQLANIERDPGKGLGIGLSICRALAKAMNTTIGMRSRPGRGSVFWIELPRGEALEAAANADIGAAGERDDESDDEVVPLVLLLEHDHAASLSRAGHLAAWGFEVMQAKDGSAIRHALIAGRRPAAILCCETSMAGDAGEALTRLLATLVETEAPRPLLIALTNDTAEGDGPAESAPLWTALANARLSAAAPPGRLRAMLNQLLLTSD